METYTFNYFQVTHTYSKNPSETDYYIRTYLTEQQTINALLTIQFKSEDLDLNDEGIELSDYEFKHILQRYFPVEVIPYHPKKQFNLINIYVSREANCGPNYFSLMSTPIANNHHFIQDIQKGLELTVLSYNEYFSTSSKI